MTKRILSLIITGMMIFSILCAPAAAAEVSVDSGVTSGIAVPNYNYNSYFTGSTGTLNSVAGQESKHARISFGGTSDNAEITSVEFSVRVSKGSSGFYIIIISPDGTEIRILIPGSTSTVTRKYTLHDFNGEYPEGTWTIYICPVDTAGIAMATLTMTVYYGYDQYV